jgi:hypothetical protein
MDSRMLEMRAAGLSYDKIAKELGVSHGFVWNHVMGRMMATVANSADKVRARQAEIVLAAINGLWPQIVAGQPEAIRTVTTLLAHEAKLFGANSPEVSELRQTLEVVPSKTVGVLRKLAEREGLVVEGEVADGAAEPRPDGAVAGSQSAPDAS